MCISILSQLFGCGKLKTSTSFLLTFRNPGVLWISTCSNRSVAFRLKSLAPNVGFQIRIASPSISSGSIESLGMRKEENRKIWQKNHNTISMELINIKSTTLLSILFINFIFSFLDAIMFYDSY